MRARSKRSASVFAQQASQTAEPMREVRIRCIGFEYFIDGGFERRLEAMQQARRAAERALCLLQRHCAQTYGRVICIHLSARFGQPERRAVGRGHSDARGRLFVPTEESTHKGRGRRRLREPQRIAFAERRGDQKV
jgi:hypothetical protein